MTQKMKPGYDGELREIEDVDRHTKADEARRSKLAGENGGEGHSYQNMVRIAHGGSHFQASISRGKGALETRHIRAWEWIRGRHESAAAVGLGAVDPQKETVDGGNHGSTLPRSAALIDYRNAMDAVGRGRPRQALIWGLENPHSNIVCLGRALGLKTQHRGELRLYALPFLEMALERVSDFYTNRG